jgi:hypothetical protein
MVRLNLLVEGQTEETFVKRVLVPHLAERGVFATPRLLATRTDAVNRRYKGGLLSFAQFRRDLSIWMKQDRNRDAVFSSMIDLYALPDDFPGKQDVSPDQDPQVRVAALEQSLVAAMGDDRFLPYIQLHEFETLLLAEPTALVHEFPDAKKAIEPLASFMQSREPEDVDDTPDGAPSRRIAHHLPAYLDRKASAGPATAERIGLATLRARCRHFGTWLERLERLAEAS